MNPQDKDAFKGLLIQAAHILDTYAIRTDLCLPYDVQAGLIGAAHDIRQGAIALEGAPGAADVYLNGAKRELKGLAQDHPQLVGEAAETARALNIVLRTLKAFEEAAGRSPGASAGR